jgi:RNA polymerase sigma-70 factor (ECF subfamily)
VSDQDARETLSRLAVLHHGALFGYCRRRLGRDAEAEDALQETFLRAHKYWASLDQERDPRKWLFGIAHNVCVEIARSRAKNVTMDELPDIGEAQSATSEALSRIAHAEKMVAIRRELERMPDKAKRILELRFFGQMDSKDIAKLEGMNETAVRVCVHRALESLREKLGKNAE